MLPLYRVIHILNFVLMHLLPEALKEYITILLAGLGGSPHLMSATILAIGRVMYEFKGNFFPI